MKKITCWLIAFLLAVFANQSWAVTGTTTTNGFLYKPPLGARGETEKNTFDAGLNRVDARLGKEIWVGDPNYGTTLQAAITAIGNNNVILHVPAGTHNLAADLTVPINVTLKPERGAVFAVATGKTLTITGSLSAGLYRIFSCAGTGKVVFGPGAVKGVYPEWWGADPTGATDSLVAFQAAAAAMNFASSGYGSASAIDFHGAPGATYLLSAPVAFQHLYAYRETPLKVDGHGATVKMMGVGNDLFYPNSAYGPIEVCNWRFQGAAPFVYPWATSYGSLPTAVTFNGTPGTKQTSFAALNAPQQWYYDAGTTTLYITSTQGMTNPNTIYASGVKADGNSLTFTVPYEKGIGIKSSSGVGLRILDCWFADLDIAIQLNYMLFSKIDSIIGTRLNKLIEMNTLVGTCNCNSVTNIEVNNCFGNEVIYVEDGITNYFGNIDTEGIKYRSFYCKNAKNLTIDNWHREATCQGDDFASKYDYQNLFDGCQSTTIRNSVLWGEYSSITGLHAVLKLDGCRGFILDNCMLPDTHYTNLHDYIYNPFSCLYMLGSTPSNGFEIRNCNLGWSVLSYSGSHIAKVTNPSFKGTGGSGAPIVVSMPASFLEYGTPITEFCNNPIFATNPSHSETGCYAARDGTVTYRGAYSWKIAMSGADGDKHASQLNSFFTATSGTKYGLLTVVYKADTDMNITLTAMGGAYSLFRGINVTGDSNWKMVSCFLDAGFNDKSALEIQSSKGSGNLWIGEVRWYYFDTLAELLQYIGKIPHL